MRTNHIKCKLLKLARRKARASVLRLNTDFIVDQRVSGEAIRKSSMMMAVKIGSSFRIPGAGGHGLYIMATGGFRLPEIPVIAQHQSSTV